jgi:hypothetical protein
MAVPGGNYVVRSFMISTSYRIIKIVVSRKMSVTFGTKERGRERVLVAKHEGKRPLGKPRRKWKDVTKMYLKGTGW